MRKKPDLANFIFDLKKRNFLLFSDNPVKKPRDFMVFPRLQKKLGGDDALVKNFTDCWPLFKDL